MRRQGGGRLAGRVSRRPASTHAVHALITVDVVQVQLGDASNGRGGTASAAPVRRHGHRV